MTERRGHTSPRRSPVARFFGESAASGNPFDLLRVDPSRVTDAAIITALNERLKQLATHDHGDTPEADEVRLAMHAAAAQLLDPHVRQHMVVQWGGRASAFEASAEEDAARPHSAARVVDTGASGCIDANVELEHDVVLAMALHGGFSAKALQHLVSLAHARGMSSEELAHVLAHMRRGGVPGRSAVGEVRSHAHPPRQTTSPDAVRTNGEVVDRDGSPRIRERSTDDRVKATAIGEAPSRSAPREMAERDPAEAMLRKSTVVALAGSALVIAVALGIGLVVLTPTKPPPLAPTITQKSPGRAEKPPMPSDVSPMYVISREPKAADPSTTEGAKPAEVGFEAANVLRRLAACAAGAEIDPFAAVEEFESWVGAIRSRWPSLRTDEITSVNHGVVEFIYRVSSAPLACERALEAVAGLAGAREQPSLASEDVAPFIWSAGMLARLSRERDLPATITMRIRQNMGRIFGDVGLAKGGATFDAGAQAALAMLTAQLAGTGGKTGVDAGAWQEWLKCAQALFAGEARTRAVLSGLESLMVQGPDPSRDEGTFRAIRTLAGALRWGRDGGGESRAWLLARFDDARVSASDLHTVTGLLVGLGVGVDVTMVVPVLASDQLRVEMRDRYAHAWGLDPGLRRDELTLAVSQAARTVLDDASFSRGAAEHLTSAVVMSRLSEAARWIHRGRTDEASRLLDELDAGLDATGASPSPKAVVTMQRGGRGWTERYLAAGRNVPVRLSLLDELEHGVESTAPDAEVLVSEAMRGSPAAVRLRARQLVITHANDPAIVAAMLEALPLIYETPQASDLVQIVASESLPPVTEDRWRLAARRALVERLLQLTAAEGEYALVDRHAELLAKSYMGRIADVPVHDGATIAAIEVSAARMWTMWRDAIRPGFVPQTSIAGLSLDAIERQRAGRLAIARGLVQVFAAQQVSVCELMAVVVAQERPDAAEEIVGILETLAIQRRSATSILKQIQDVEAAMLRLWLVRLGEAPA